jgi:HEAT repeat protein
MTTARQKVWLAMALLALLIIVAAAIYFRSDFESVDARERAVAQSVVAPEGTSNSASAVGPTPAVTGSTTLRGAEIAVSKINLPETVALLKKATAVDAPLISPAVAALLSAQEAERAEAVEVLGFSEDARFVPPIIHLLRNDPSPAVRSAAASALELHRGREVAAVLAQALTDPSEDVRAHSLLSLKFQRDSHVERELLVQLKNGDLDEATALEVRLFLDRHYVRKDPFKDPVAP